MQDIDLSIQLSIFANCPPAPSPPSALQKGQSGTVEHLRSSSGRIDGHRSLSLAPLTISAPFLRVYQASETNLGLIFCLEHGKDAIFAQNVEKNRNETGLESGWWVVSGNPPPDVLELKRYVLVATAGTRLIRRKDWE